jgi:hypothetical protein
VVAFSTVEAKAEAMYLASSNVKEPAMAWDGFHQQTLVTAGSMD